MTDKKRKTKRKRITKKALQFLQRDLFDGDGVIGTTGSSKYSSLPLDTSDDDDFQEDDFDYDGSVAGDDYVE